MTVEGVVVTRTYRAEGILRNVKGFEISDTLDFEDSTVELALQEGMKFTDLGRAGAELYWLVSTNGVDWMVEHFFIGNVNKATVLDRIATLEFSSEPTDLLAIKNRWSDVEQQQRFPGDGGFGFLKFVSENGSDWP